MPSYFLGCPTPEGFETHVGGEMKSGKYFTYIIKGGPGTGKSSFMKKIAAALSDLDSPDLYFCSSDPDSLDAVIFPRLGVILADGTSPHVFEPVYPGARERILDLGRFWKSGELRANAAKIISVSDENARLHQRAKRYLGAVHNLGADIISMGEAALLRDKTAGYCKRLAAKVLPRTGRRDGCVKLRQICSVTPRGVLTQKSAYEGCRLFSVSDPYFAASDMILKSVSAQAASLGYMAVASKNVLLPGCVYEYLVIPELKIAFVPESAAEGEEIKKINALRFYDREALRERRRRFIFNTGAKRELTYAVIEALARAKTVHDELEAYYISAMDFDAVTALCEETAAEIRENSREKA